MSGVIAVLVMKSLNRAFLSDGFGDGSMFAS